jgi:hypothetical protein
VRTETHPISEMLQSLVLSIPDDGQSPKKTPILNALLTFNSSSLKPYSMKISSAFIILSRVLVTIDLCLDW